MRREYRSPQHKLLTFFQASRDRWRERAREYQSEIRRLEVRVRDVEASREHWREKYFRSRKERQAGGAPEEPAASPQPP